MMRVVLGIVAWAALAIAYAEPAVETRVWVEPDHDIVVGQQLTLNIEVATDRWFSGGTRIGGVEIPGAVVLQREHFAVNSTRTNGDTIWTVQQYSITVYPRTAGDYRVPAIAVQLSVAGDDGTATTHRVQTKPLQFHATLPAALAAERDWVATTQYTVEESFNRPLDDLKPGDAIERRIVFSAVDLPAMMLPEISPESNDGLAVYRKTPVVQDNVNRGSVTATRTEVLTYVVEKPGRYTLKPLRYPWWNLASGSLETIELPGHLLNTGGAGESIPGVRHARRVVWLGAAGVAGLGALLVWIVIYKRGRALRAAGITSRSESPGRLRRAYRAALRRRDYRDAAAILYRWYGIGVPDFRGVLREQLAAADGDARHQLFDRLMRLAFGDMQSGSKEGDPGVALRALEPSRPRPSRAGGKPSTPRLNPD